MGNSFQYPLPWQQCPIDVTTNDTGTDTTEKLFKMRFHVDDSPDASIMFSISNHQ